MRADELGTVGWRKSSHSGSGDNCVEVAHVGRGRAAVRDSKDPHGSALVAGLLTWVAFLDAVGTDGFRRGTPGVAD